MMVSFESVLPLIGSEIDISVANYKLTNLFSAHGALYPVNKARGSIGGAISNSRVVVDYVTRKLKRVS
jgi:hypothetical protein